MIADRKLRQECSWRKFIGLFLMTMAVVVSAGILIVVYQQRDKLDKRPFDAELWRQGSIRDRGRMVDDLIDSKRLIGLDKKGVLELLGSPGLNDFYQLDIGTTFFGTPWTYTLRISYGPNGVVMEVDMVD